MTNRAESSQSAVSQSVFGAAIILTTMLGMQLIRGLLPYLQPLLGERLGWGTINVGLFALAVFLCAFLAGPLNRFLGSGLLILICGFAIGLSRLAAQLWTGEPLLDLIYATTGVVAFILFLPTAVGLVTGSQNRGSLTLAIGILAGLAFDLALNGAFFSYDLFWQNGLWPTVIVVLLVLAQWWLLFRLLRMATGSEPADTRFSAALSWSLIGPFLFLQLLIFSNLGWATTSTGYSYTTAFFWLLLAHAVGLAIWLLPAQANRIILAAAWISAFLCQVLLLMGWTDAWITAVYLLCGQAALAGSLVAAVGYLKQQATGDGLRNISIAGGIGMILLVILLFVYYAGYDIALPFSNQILPLVALLLAALFSFPALRSWWKYPLQIDQSFLRPLTAVVLISLLIPLLLRFTQQSPLPSNSGSHAVRVMTYNLHYGANPQGQLDLEALAQVIEAQDPDVVGLQEVSRGWVISGSVDMLVWLAQRLNMTLLFGPASDTQWGNAILTKLPVIEQGNYPLPTEDLLLRRQFIHARLSGPDAAEFNLIDTHYHNPEDGGDIRVQQSQTILDFANGMPRTIVMGDMNAEHGMLEIDMLEDGGYGDVLDLTDTEPGYTNPVPGPTRRIDYIWITPDWGASSAVVPYSEASDHLPIAVSLE